MSQIQQNLPELPVEEKAQLEKEARRLEFYKARVRIIPALAARCKAEGCYGRRGYHGVDWKNGTLLLCCGDLGGTDMSQIIAGLKNLEVGFEALYRVSAFGWLSISWRWFKRNVFRMKE